MTGEKNEETVDGSDMLLSYAISNDILLDVSRSPLTDFHYQERYHQGKLVKVQTSPSKLDNRGLLISLNTCRTHI